LITVRDGKRVVVCVCVCVCVLISVWEDGNILALRAD
jgi:hypothetical protein